MRGVVAHREQLWRVVSLQIEYFQGTTKYIKPLKDIYKKVNLLKEESNYIYLTLTLLSAGVSQWKSAP